MCSSNNIYLFVYDCVFSYVKLCMYVGDVCLLTWNCMMCMFLFEFVYCVFSYLNLYFVFAYLKFHMKCEWLWKCLFCYVCFYVDLKLYNMCLFIRNCRLYVCSWFWQCQFLFVCLYIDLKLYNLCLLKF